MNETITNKDQGFWKAIFVQAIVPGIVSAVVAFGMYSYQSYKEYLKNQKPVMDIDDEWTKNNTSYNSLSKYISFQLGIRNVTISNISLVVEDMENLGEIFQLSVLDGRGGGFDKSNINIASVKLNSKTKRYQLFDIKSHINLFRKETVPFIVNYQGNISNEFFRVFLRENNESIIYGLKINIEGKKNKSSIGKEFHVSSTNTHHFTFINPKSIKRLINKYPATIVANNLFEYQKTFREYFKNSVKVEYQLNDNKKYLIFENGDKVVFLEKYSSPSEMHFRLIKKANKANSRAEINPNRWNGIGVKP